CALPILRDVHGNVWEWCEDWFDPEYYKTCPSQDPVGPPVGGGRVIRGGGYDSPGTACRSAVRSGATAYGPNIGLRVVCEVGGKWFPKSPFFDPAVRMTFDSRHLDQLKK